MVLVEGGDKSVLYIFDLFMRMSKIEVIPVIEQGKYRGGIAIYFSKYWQIVKY